MATALDLIKLAMLDIGTLYQGQSPNTEETADALARLNYILDSWSRMGRLVYTHSVGSFSLAADTPGYTLGVGGAWVTTAWPTPAQGAVAISGKFQQGVEVMRLEDFEKSIANGQGLTATLPSRLGYNNAAPLRAVRVWPTPNATATIELPYWLPLTAFALSSTPVSFPVPGYEAALVAELAAALAPSYGKAVSTEMAANYQRWIERITDANQAIQAGQQPQAKG